mgnify:CR=1 FL=1
MKTKRLKKLLMGMGLSRNQANHMVKDQRATGSLRVSQKVHLRVNAGLVTAYRKLCTRKRRRGCRGHQQKMSPPVLVTRTSPKGDGIHKPHHL